MSRSARRWAAAAAAMILAIVLGLFLFPRHDAASARTTGTVASPVKSEGDTAASQKSRLDAILRRAHGRSAELPKLTLTGKVVDTDDKPVAGATVVLAAPHRTVVTAADGAFAFEALPPARYTLEAQSGSRLGGPQVARLTQSSTPVTLRLYRALTAEILVVSKQDGRPIAGADVWLRMASNLEPAGNHYGKTAPDGKAVFPGVQIAGHDLIVSARGYAGAVLGPEVLTRDGDSWRVRVELAPGDGVAGLVVDEKGKPVEGAMLEAVPYSGENATAPVDETAIAREAGNADPHVIARRRIGPVTGADGRFWLSLPDEERSQWVIVASHPELQSVASEPIFRSGSHQVHEVKLTMPRGAHAAGWVVTADDEPIAGATIQIRWQAIGAAFLEKTIQADGRGHFETTGVPPAPMELIAFAEGGSSVPVRVDFADPPREDLVLVLDNTGVIEGVVVDGRGKPLPGIMLTYGELQHDVEHLHVLPGTETTGEDGRFVLRGLGRGDRYHISATRPQDGDFVVHEGWVEAQTGENVRIRIPDGGSITGHVAIEGGRSPAGITVLDHNTFASTSVQASGRFKLSDLPPGPYELDFSGPAVPHQYRKVIVDEAKETDLGDVQLHAGRPVAGIVTTSKGEPIVAPVRVTVDGKYRLQVVSRADGRFKVTAPTGVPLSVVATTGGAGESKPVAISPSGAGEGLTLVLEAGGTVQGTAMANNEPMANFVVAAYRAGPRPAEPSAYAQVDAAGGYQLAHLVPGTYDVELIFPSDGTGQVRVYRKTVTVESGATVDASFDGTKGSTAGIPQPDAAEPDIPTYELANEL